MKITAKLSTLAFAASLLAAGAAHSAVVSLSGITAEWYDGNPSANVTYYNNNTTTPKARWGNPVPSGGQQSGYDYVVAAQPINFSVPPTPSPTQVLGTFTHQNFPIAGGTSITDIKLRIKATVEIDGVQQGSGPLDFEYGFDHWETSNGADPCADGGDNGIGVNSNGCADRVIANWLSTSDSFVVNTGTTIDTYTLNILGFSLDEDGTVPFASFWTAEGQKNDAYLVGNVELVSKLIPNEVPEPTSLALVGLSLAGLAASRRRKAAQA